MVNLKSEVGTIEPYLEGKFTKYLNNSMTEPAHLDDASELEKSVSFSPLHVFA